MTRATLAGYSQQGAAWLKELMRYVGQNVETIEAFLAEKLPEVKLYRPEETYVCWLDFGATGLSDETLVQRILVEKEIVTDSGTWFGPGGEGCMRLNLACPRKTVLQALERIYEAIHKCGIYTMVTACLGKYLGGVYALWWMPLFVANAVVGAGV